MTSITQTTPSASSALTASSGDAIVFEHVVKTFSKGSARRHALQGLSFQARPGRVTGLVGPDGAGKTTTMRLAAGLLRPDEGRVAIFGLDSVRDADRAKRLVAYMPQRFGLYEDLTVAENLALYADLHGLPSSQRRPLFDELLTTTGLAPFTSRLAGRLSGGMQQKLALSCSLLSDPRLLLLDEPTSGVDPASRRDLWRIVLNVVRRRNVAALVSTVYMDETQRCDHVVMLRQGRALDAGPPEQFLQRVQGRCFLIPAHSEQRRTVQLHVSTLPGVVDAPLQANGVRVVLSPDAPPETRSAIASHNGAAVTPRFEDAFIDLLRRETSAAVGDPPRSSPAAAHKTERSSPPDQAPVIVVENATRRFGSFTAVHEVSFTVHKGEIFGLLGANGAGKTTTFRMLCGLLPATSGSLHVAGVNMRRAPARAKARIGYMSQRFSLYRELTTQDNLRFFAGAYGLRGRRRHERIEWAIHEFDLASVLHVVSANLPHGFQQRLAFACALMHEPDVLFLDEPTSGVDLLARREFWRRISSLAQQGVTVLVTTHFMEEAEQCDRIVIMRAGRILAAGAPDEIRVRAGRGAAPAASLEDAFLAILEHTEASPQPSTS